MKTKNSLKYPALRQQLICDYRQIDPVFDSCMDVATSLLTEQGVEDYLKAASDLAVVYKGASPILTFLEEMPLIAKTLGIEIIPPTIKAIQNLALTPNKNAIPALVESLSEAARLLRTVEQMQHYFDLIQKVATLTIQSIHTSCANIYKESTIINMIIRMPYLLDNLTVDALRNWIEYGLRNYSNEPERQCKYFMLELADSRAMFQRERHGSLFIHHERSLNLYLQGLWRYKNKLVPFSEGWDDVYKPLPYYNKHRLCVPDRVDDDGDITGVDGYRAILAHMMAHQRWSHAIAVDGYSHMQRITIELMEDSRVEYLAMKKYPGLRRLWLSLHPIPEEGACDASETSCILHRLAMLSYAILNPDHDYQHEDIIEFSQRFHELMVEGDAENSASIESMESLGAEFFLQTECDEDHRPKVHFKDTIVSYRDDNRHLWLHTEESDDESQNIIQSDNLDDSRAMDNLPVRHYSEWDYVSKTYRPDWTSIYESIHESSNPESIDKILDKHSGLAKRLKQILDQLKPHDHVRVRYQEEGSELDLDVAIRSLIDFKGGATPDPRININHKHDGRDIAVTLLIDLSASVDDMPEGCSQTVLDLSREAVTLLAWAIERLGDPFSIAGFHSDTRHNVHYTHLKSFSEAFDDRVKGRLASMKAGLSTRMGAAMRNAGHYLKEQEADKRLLLILTDGEPADVDVGDVKLLIQDARKVVEELDQQDIFTYCISLDPNADDYVKDIFGAQYTVIDHVMRLPEKLPELFLSLTK